MKIICLIVVLVTCSVDSWRVFRNGRMVGGNLGEPHKNNLLSETVAEDKWFNQTLDHFTPSDERKWQQRYFVNDEYFDASKGGPVFLMIGGEGEASAKWMNSGAWVEYGKKYGALLFQLEHRYYGKSHPTVDLSVQNLQFLTSQQALADLATFIEAMNEEYKLDYTNKWIAFGGSYPGSLAAWLRFKYPHLVHGAMSASGPLLAVVDFKDYFRVVDEALETSSEECVSAVRDGTNQLEELLNDPQGRSNITSLFKLCDPIQDLYSSDDSVSNLFETLSGNFAGIVQYNKDNRNTSATWNVTIDDLCNIMTNEVIGSPMERLAALNSFLLELTDQTCLDYKYETMINEMKNTSWDSEVSEGGRQWTYQTCTEFGFYQTSSYKPQVFGDKFPVNFFVKQCQDIFGDLYDADFLEQAVERTNTIYGALDIEVSNVVFVHGSIDPWHALGITKTRDQNAPAIYINGTAHCANMYTPSDNDLPQLKAARVEISNLIGTWLDL